MTHYPPRQGVLLVAPAIEPVTLAETKLFLRIDSTEEDSLILALTTVARQLVEKYLAKVLITQTWQMTQRMITGQAIALIPAPIQAITSVTILNGQTTQTLVANAYEFNKEEEKLELKSSYNGDSITIEMVSGYGSAEQVPAPIKHAILSGINHLYHNRDAQPALDYSITNLLDPYCEIRL